MGEPDEDDAGERGGPKEWPRDAEEAGGELALLRKGTEPRGRA